MSDDDSGTCCCLLIAGYLFIRLLDSIGEYVEEIIGMVFLLIIIYSIYYLFKHSKRRDENENKNAGVLAATVPSAANYTQSQDKELKPGNYPFQASKNSYESHTSADVGNNETEVEVESYHQLSVEVMDEKGEPIEKASVSIESDKEASQEKISDIDGKVIFPKLKKANYKVTVYRDGYEKGEKSIFLNSQQKVSIKLKEYFRLQLKILDETLQCPVSGALIKVGGKTYTSGENGMVLVPNLLKGNSKIEIEKNMYFSKTVDFEIKDRENEFTLYLNPNITLESKHVEFRNELENGLLMAFSRLPMSANTLLSGYYRTVLISLLEMIESIALNPLYRENSDTEERLNELYAALRVVFRDICDTLTRPDMINDLIDLGNLAEGKRIPEMDINHNQYRIYIRSYMNSPLEFTDKFKGEIEKKLSTVDQEITDNYYEYVVSPIEGLWAISKELIKDKTGNTTYEAAHLLIGSVILDAAEDMFKKEEIVSILKKD